MTNREWLESLPNADLARAIVKIRDVAPHYFYGYTDTVYGIGIWLEKEHEEEQS